MNNAETIRTFYESFQKKDWKKMQACYHEKVIFSDPVFLSLKGGKANAMWHMLVEASTDLEITFNNVSAQGSRGSCHWEAVYTFSKTKRRVHNRINASFEFDNGLIVRHTDKFDMWKWTRMALGLPGTLLGWTPLLQGKVRKMAAGSLEKFIRDNPTYGQEPNSKKML